MSGPTRAPATTPDGDPAGGGRRSRRPVLTGVIVVASGLVLGFLTLLGQKWLHGAWLAAVNSGALWLLPAFVAGSFMRTDSTAAAAGAVLLIAAVVGYYAPVPLVVQGAAASSRSVAIWIATALVGGPVYGLAGPVVAPAARVAVVGSAGTPRRGVPRRGRGAAPRRERRCGRMTTVAVGLALPLALGRSARDRAIGLVATVPVVALTAVAYAVINWAFLHS